MLEEIRDVPEDRVIESKWIELTPGEMTHYHDRGAGAPVVLLHGSGVGVSAAANWYLNFGPLSEEFRVISYDQLGFGQTVAAPGETYGIDAWVGHLIRLLDALSVERAVLVGNSMGGWIGLQATLDHPERVLGVVPMGSGHLPFPVTEVLRSHGKPEFTRDGIHRVLLDFVVRPELATDDLVEMRYQAATKPGAPERYAKVVAARNASPDLDEAALAKMETPALIIHGREDRVWPSEVALRLHGLLPHSDLHILEQSGHWSQIERCSTFNLLIADFVRRVWNGRS